MKKILTYLLALWVLLPAASVSAQQRNVLFIAIDDIKPLLGCYGNTTVVSPNIDRLADEGVLFTRAYCQWPVCGPTRASLLTGQTPDGSGIRNLSSQLREVSPGITTLPQYFKDNGYTTAAIGKVFDPRNVDDGHDSLSWSQAYTPWSSYTYPPEYGDFIGGQWRVEANTATECGPEGVGDDGYLDGQFCNEALSKLDGFASSGKPFFLAVGFKKPHIPFVAPKKYWDLYQEDSFDLAPFQQPAVGSPDYAYHKPEPKKFVDIPDEWTYNDPALGDSILDPAHQRRLLHGYYACVSYIDAQVGKLLEKLKEKGLDQNTVIVVFGDHGYHLGDHNQWGKHTVFEQAARVPFLFYVPGGQPSRYEHPVEFLDIFPTLCDLTGVEIPRFIQGKSLAGVIAGSRDPVKKVAVTEYRSGGHATYSFRNERYRYTLRFNNSGMRPDVEAWDPSRIVFEELYDYATDPFETRNFADDPLYAEVRDSMLTLAQQWWDEQHAFFTPSQTVTISREEPLVLYPNPAGHFLYSNSKTPMDIAVYNISGRMMLNKKECLFPLEISALENGLYFLHTRSGDTDQVNKFIISH